MSTGSEINLKRLQETGLSERIRAARSLSDAVHDPMANLHKELPLPYVGYQSWPEGLRRLRAASRHARAMRLAPFLIEYGDDVVGMATVQAYEPTPNPLGSHKGAEISYWHRRFPDFITDRIGRNVVPKLVNVGLSNPRISMLWSVTLLDDIVKPEILLSSGFEKVGGADFYELGDQVSELRQMWARTRHSA